MNQCAVVMNVNSGEVLAMCSYPTFKPEYFTGKLDPDIWEDIKKVNKMMAPYKSIKKLEIKHEPFVKTTTMKIKRFEELKKDK